MADNLERLIEGLQKSELSRREFIDQFIPKVHQERVLATLNGASGVQEA